MDNIIGTQKSEFYFSRYWKTNEIENLESKPKELPKGKLMDFFFFLQKSFDRSW